MKKLREQERSQIEQKRREYESRIQQCAAEQKALSAENLRMYENLVDGSLSQDEYIRQKSDLADKLEKVRSEETEIRGQLAELAYTDCAGFEAYQGLLEVERLTIEQVCSLLERVTIFPGGRFEIKLRYPMNLTTRDRAIS